MCIAATLGLLRPWLVLLFAFVLQVKHNSWLLLQLKPSQPELRMKL
jgi:hypothetical protein